ncbi:BMP family ABC transporter substrate-binding protein [Niveispirillum sp. SYP-B3756]|uniref:BMP family lipoprotein n=1 Tax=Niveispirillum sp. SYP-B3756 TaxID=2662178 RepID=UPI001564722E|nr:BMP family ABC transporter substrate-binding protein [Niveispirillum sp. SYP-B3756]
MRRWTLGLLIALVLAGPAAAAPFQPCVVYTEAGKFDKSFNEMAYAGVTAFQAGGGAAVKEFEPSSPADYVPRMEAAVQAGCSDIVVIGFRFAEDLATVAPRHPSVHFSIIDGVVEGTNVASILFAENEGAYLAGVAAALASQTGHLGFIGGMPVPVIRRFQAGFTQGVRDTRPDARVSVAMLSDSPKGFADPFAGSEAARDLLASGVDVVFPAAGASGLGALDAMSAAGRLGIGVDSNQDYLYPGHILTSMVKRLDRAVKTIFETGAAGGFRPGLTRLGLREGGVDVTITPYNRTLWTADVEAAVKKAREDILAGRIKVGDETAVPS